MLCLCFSDDFFSYPLSVEMVDISFLSPRKWTLIDAYAPPPSTLRVMHRHVSFVEVEIEVEVEFEVEVILAFFLLCMNSGLFVCRLLPVGPLRGQRRGAQEGGPPAAPGASLPGLRPRRTVPRSGVR